MSRKYEAVNLMKMYTEGNFVLWNDMLTDCVRKLDINRLAVLRYSLQAGMDDLAKRKLNTPKINEWWARLMRSTEITAKRIIKIKHPMALDNPLMAKTHKHELAAKRKRDKELAKFLQESSY